MTRARRRNCGWQGVIALAFLLFGRLGETTAAPPDSAQDRQVRGAVERGLAFLELGSVGWNRSYTCVMCHHQPMLVWAHNEARSRGIPVDDEKLRQWTDRTWSKLLAPASYRLHDSDEEKLIADGVPPEAVAKVRSVQRPIFFPTEAEFLSAVGQYLTADELARHRAALVKRASRGNADFFTFTSESEKTLAADGVPSEVIAKLELRCNGWHPFYHEKDFVAELGKRLSADELNKHRAALLKHGRHRYSLTIVGHRVEDSVLATDGIPFEVVAKLAPLRVGSAWGGGLWTEEEYLAAVGKVLSADELKRHRAALLKHAPKPESYMVILSEPALAADGIPADLVAKLKPIARSRTVASAEAFLAEAAKVIPPAQLEPHRATLLRHAAPGGAVARRDLESLAWLLVGRRRDGDVPKAQSVRDLAAALMGAQEPDGHWHFGRGGQQGSAEWHDIATMWSALALDTLKDNPDAVRSRDRALAWIKDRRPGRRNETVFLHLLIAHRFGPASRVEELLKEMSSRQNADGGWGTWEDRKSDGYGTGHALYALSLVGQVESDSARRARKYLLDHQQRDGSWGFASGDDVPGYWGAAWAVIGLTQTLPRSTK